MNVFMHAWQSVFVLALAATALFISNRDAQAQDANWPMLAHDVQRSGTTAEAIDVRSPLKRLWYRAFVDEGISSGVQPIVYGNSLYVGTLRGVMHAIDIETGADQWEFRAGGAILHAAATDGERLYFGAANGSIYALGCNDGLLRWALPTGAAVWNAPAVHEHTVYVGSRDGHLYAIDAESGTVRWSRPTGGPILCSPAIDARNGRVVVGSEDMHVYCFGRDGELRWKSAKLPGFSLRGYHPVIAPDGAVMISSAPFVGMDRIHEVLYAMVREVFGDFASWRHTDEENRRLRTENFALMEKPETYERQLASLRDQLSAEPSLQTFFLLDGDTGKSRGIVPIVHSESMNGPTMPALVRNNAQVIVKYSALLRSRYQSYSPFLNVGVLDFTTGRIDPLLDETRTYGWHDSLLLVHDEQSQLMIAGDWLLNTHQNDVNAVNLETRIGLPQPLCRNVHEVRPGQPAALWSLILAGESLPVGWEWYPRGTAVYGGGSVMDVPVVVAGERMFYLPTHELNAGCTVIAYEAGDGDRQDVQRDLAPAAVSIEQWDELLSHKWDWDTLEARRLAPALVGLPQLPAGTRLAPLFGDAEQAVMMIGDQELDRFIDEPAQLSLKLSEQNRNGAPNPLRTKLLESLNTAVEELTALQWQPLRIPAGKHPVEAYLIFDDPAETLYTLALAWPLLDEQRRAIVAVHVERMLAPQGAFWKNAYPSDDGAVRTLFDPAPDHLVRYSTDIHRTPTGRIYCLWLWAQATGDVELVRTHWEPLREQVKFDPDEYEPDLGNGRLAGLIAACRCAHLAGDSEWLESARPRVRQALRERLRYELAHSEGGVITVAPEQRLHFGRWHFLTPDLARLLHEYALPIHKRLVEVYVDYHRPTWWLAWNVELMWRNETPVSLPSMSADVFAARALVLKQSTEQLAEYIDLPWCRADEYYIQKLALALMARPEVATGAE